MKQTLLLAVLLLSLACTHSPSSTTQGEIVQETPTPIEVKNIETDSLPYDVDYLTGHFDPAEHPDFVSVDQKHADRAGLYLHQDTYTAFQQMYEAALTDGIKLIIRSATRNFNSQKRIWEAKWRGERKLEGTESAPTAYPVPKDRALAILRYSSMPGTSRHHWGTDIDLNNFTNEYFQAGEGKKIYDWLLANAASYGFCQPYTEKGDARPDGYNEERWHWSYLPISQALTQMAQSGELQNHMINGFEGAETASEIQVVEKYVLGINQACLLRGEERGAKGGQ